MIRVTVPRPVAEALMDGSLRLLVVEDAGHNWSYPPPDSVRAIKAGERIGIDVECETCEGDGFRQVEERLPGNHNYEQWKCPACNTKGVVPVGSVLPTEVIPVYAESAEPHPHWVDRCLVVFHDGGVVFEPGIDAVDERAAVVTEPLSLYGDPASLVGRYAVVCEDARREP